tara:strand:+ start:4457 stop:4696 length:240 start_codon:yes stop_codon:yes gene_type:complete
MKNIKDIVIGIFAVVGFAAIVTGFTNEAVQEHTVPESHVWGFSVNGGNNPPVGGYLFNKQTGELYRIKSENKEKVEENK